MEGDEFVEQDVVEVCRGGDREDVLADQLARILISNKTERTSLHLLLQQLHFPNNHNPQTLRLTVHKLASTLEHKLRLIDRPPAINMDPLHNSRQKFKELDLEQDIAAFSAALEIFY